MASILDLISGQVNAVAGNAKIPANLKDQVLGGLSNSVLGSLTQTVAQPGGVDQIKDLVTGKVKAASSPVTALASSMFNADVLQNLNLGKAGNSLKNLVPKVMASLGNIIKDQDGDGDIDFNDLIATLQGGNAGGILGAAKSILGGILGGK
ncbi:MAG: hypothetical protein J6S62_00330 [Bacteroidales bacterium]|nr:hypothetical protein [Bacteroidales bacterium]